MAAAVVLTFAVVAMSLWTAKDVSAQTTSLTLSTLSASPGQTVDVIVRGWDSGEVDIHWNDSSCRGNSEIAILPQSSVREFRGKFTVPQGTAPGTYSLYLYVHGYEPPCRLGTNQFKVVAPATPTPAATPPPAPPVIKPPTEKIAPPTPTPTPTEKPSCPETDNLKLPTTKTSDVLVVLVHGWLPDLIGEEHGPDVWDDLLLVLGRAKLAGTAKADVSVLDWSSAASSKNPGTGGWLNLTHGAGLGLREPKLQEALRVGNCLGDELLKHKGDYSSIHFVSHSLGAWVIDAAADKLTPEGIKTHLTFLDAYVLDPNKNRGKLGDRATFAEQFFSEPGRGLLDTGELLPEAHNFDVTKTLADGKHMTLTDEHGWPVEWYATSSKRSDHIGLDSTWEMGSAPLGYKDGDCTPLRSDNSKECGVDAPKKSTVTDFSSLRVDQRKGSVSIADSKMYMRTASPASGAIHTSEVAERIGIDLTATFAGSGSGKITYAVNGLEPFTEEFGASGLDGLFWIVLDQEQPITTITVTLDTLGQGQSTAEIRSLTFVRSAPSGPIASVTPQPPKTGGGPGAGSTDDGIPWAAGALVFAAVLTGIGVTGARLRNRR